MRIAFVSANRENMPDPVVPLGLLYIMEVTPKHHERMLIDLCWERDPLECLHNRLCEFAPDLVAVGLRNIQNSDYSGTRDNVAYYERLMQTIRASTRAPVVLGGGGFSVLPRGLMQRLSADFGIAGEGELAFAQLLLAIEAGATDFSNVGGLLWRRDGGWVANLPQPSFQDLDALPMPDRSVVDPRYYANIGIESVQTKRGCALKCDYCTYPTIEGRAVRARRPKLVVDELFASLEQHPNIKHFFIVDSVFNIPPRHAKAVCREMIARGFSTPWTCYANPLGFDSELAELLARSGCAGMEIGSDSGCDDILDQMRKGFHTDKIERMHKLCVEAGLRDCHTFILGTRGETMDHVHRTLDFLHKLDPFAAILMIWTDDYEALDPDLAARRLAFREQICELLAQLKDSNPRWIVPSLSVNFDPRLFHVLRRRGLHGPLWQHIRRAEGEAPVELPRVGVTSSNHRSISTAPLA